MNYLLFILIVLNGLIVFLVLRNRPAGNDEKLNEIKSQTDLLLSSLSRLENNNHEEFRRNREERFEYDFHFTERKLEAFK